MPIATPTYCPLKLHAETSRTEKVPGQWGVQANGFDTNLKCDEERCGFWRSLCGPGGNVGLLHPTPQPTKSPAEENPTLTKPAVTG